MSEPLQIPSFVADFRGILKELGWSNQRLDSQFPVKPTIHALQIGNRDTIKAIYQAIQSWGPSYTQEQTITKDWLKEILSETQAERTPESRNQQAVRGTSRQMTRPEPTRPEPVLQNLRPKKSKAQTRSIGGKNSPK